MREEQLLQNSFLETLKNEGVSVAIYLVNGIKLQGQVSDFNQHIVMLKGSVIQMVYKHAISTIVPLQNVDYKADMGEESKPAASSSDGA